MLFLLFRSSSVRTGEEKSSLGKELVSQDGNTADESSVLGYLEKKKLKRVTVRVRLSIMFVQVVILVDKRYPIFRM